MVRLRVDRLRRCAASAQARARRRLRRAAGPLLRGRGPARRVPALLHQRGRLRRLQPVEGQVPTEGTRPHDVRLASKRLSFTYLMVRFRNNAAQDTHSKRRQHQILIMLVERTPTARRILR